LRCLVQNVGGMAAARIPRAVAQAPGCDLFGFVETWLTEGTITEVEGLLPGYQPFHCVRPAPVRGRPSGGITVFVRRTSPLLLAGGLRVESDPRLGVLWVVSAAFRLTVAICYFSPHGSAVYGSGLVCADPVSGLLAGLREAEARSHKHLVLGDMNIRLGPLSCDVPARLAAPPGALGLLPDLHALQNVPQRRTSRDRAVPHRRQAEALLNGLLSVSSVVLNGRAPGDEGGAHTCWTALTGGGLGNSVVDLACVSVDMYRQVERFRVLPFAADTSRDHCALVVELGGLCPPPFPLRPARPPVHRPRVEPYVCCLQASQHQFDALLASWRAGGVSAPQAVRQLTDLLVECARQARGSRPATPAPQGGGDQPWFDAECRAASDRLRVTWAAWHASRGGVFGSQAGSAVARAAFEAARRAYKLCCRRKKHQHQLERQHRLLEEYFGGDARAFWQALSGGRPPRLALTDVEGWTGYFAALVGCDPGVLALSPGDQLLRQAVGAAAPSGTVEDMAVLNAPVSFAEAQACMGLRAGKAPDVSGLTGELLCHAAATPPPTSEEPAPGPHSAPAVACVQWLLQSMLSSGCVPGELAVSRLVPVPKARDPEAMRSRDMHRGISVTAVMSRLLDRLANTRLQQVVERLGLRAPTQCGFRPGHGPLDAVFTVQHLIAEAQHHHRLLFAVFVDFKKAFDTVRRDVLLERCRGLGVHGPFLGLLTSMYANVCARVCVNGVLGEPVQTTIGTKQGSELSPLLFGLFVEVLHVLIEQQVPGAGPVIGGLTVPDVVYADDVTLLSGSALGAQQLLGVLEVFCRLFGMEVNLAPGKTAVVVFRRARAPVPRGFRLVYGGREVTRQQAYTYLGVVLHETRGMADAPAALAASGTRAMHALLTHARRAGVTQFDMKSRLFDALVEPALSYACQVWGPFVFGRALGSKPFDSKAEKAHSSFLRVMTGAGKQVALDVLYRDLHRLPVMYHWVVLAARWWARMSRAHAEGSGHVAVAAWGADVRLAWAGCRTCWAYHVLHTMRALTLLPTDWRSRPWEWVAGQQWAEADVKGALAGLWRSRWPQAEDPRSAPSRGLALCTHQAWVSRLSGAYDPFARAGAPAHTKLCLPFEVLRAYAQLRVGWARLEVDRGRQCRPAVPRQCRLCRLCCGEDAPLEQRRAVLARTGRTAHVEDLKHFVLECPAYDDLRAACPAFPADVRRSVRDPAAMCAVFGHPAQASLAHTLHLMRARRDDLLGAVGSN
jgi:hypothetical protein